MFELKLENANGDIVDIDDGIRYIVTSASGLEPPPAAFYTSKSPNKKGVYFNGSTLNERSLILTVKLLEDVEENRNYLYNWVDTEQYVKVHFMNNIKNVYCEGHIQECQIEFYTDNEVAVIAITCENPYWHELQEISNEIRAIISHFTFAFAIDENGIPFSTLERNTEINVFNVGAETGCKITIECSGDVRNLVIYDAKDTTRQFKIGTILRENWKVEINTETSPKTVKAFKPDGTVENLIKYIFNPTWFTLKKGNNIFDYTADSGVADAIITFSYTNKYLGV